MVRVVIDLKGAQAKLSPQAQQRGQYALANQALADMNQYVPMKDNILRQTASIDIDGSGINYNMPYAKAQFYGRVGKGGHPVRKYTTPGTGSRWDERAKSKHMGDWKEAYLKGAGY